MVDNWYVIRIVKAVVHGRVCTITCLEGVILFQERLRSQLVQEPSSQVTLGLRYDMKASVVNIWRLMPIIYHIALMSRVTAGVHSVNYTL